MHAKQRMLINSSPYPVTDKVVLIQQLHTRLLKKADSLATHFLLVEQQVPLAWKQCLKAFGT